MPMPGGAPPARLATCDGQKTKEPCTDVQVGGRTWRYAYFPAKQETADTVILDFGGPGHSVLSGEVGLSAFLGAYPSLGQRYNVVVPEERWVTQDVPADCQRAQSAYYQAMRTAPATVDAVSKDLGKACGLSDGSQQWGFDARSYNELINAISDRHKLVIKGFVGHSWGAVRMAYLDKVSFEWAILSRPFPVGVDSATLIAERTQTMADLQSKVRPLGSVDVQDRSLPVTTFDQYSAVVDLGYLDSSSFADVSPRVLDGSDTQKIGRLSDTLWMRYGRDSLSPGILAQIQETCANIGAVNGKIAQIASVGDVLMAKQAPCQAIPETPPVKAKFAPSMCVITSKLDTVTPDRLTRSTFKESSGRIRFVESQQHSHSTFDGFDQCLADQVQPAK